jgi:MarR family transcriptional regulator, organic hydroperoxide resistance regulator
MSRGYRGAVPETRDDPRQDPEDLREDLGALLARLVRRVLDAETPLLAAHDVEMWDYAVLSALRSGPAQTQARLAAAIGRDKTRLIGSLDRLEGRGLVRREPDPTDRRNRVVTLTPEGRALLGRCRADVRAMEEDLLAGIPEPDRAAFLRTLARVAPPPGG